MSSTKPPGGLNKEIEGRTEVVVIFPGDAAGVRLVGDRTLERTDGWAVGRRCLSLESLAHAGDDRPRRPPAVAT